MNLYPNFHDYINARSSLRYYWDRACLGNLNFDNFLTELLFTNSNGFFCSKARDRFIDDVEYIMTTYSINFPESICYREIAIGVTLEELLKGE